MSRGTPKKMRRRSMFEILGVKDAASQRCHEPSCPDARSQDVQSVPAGRFISHYSSPKKLTSTSIGGGLEGTFANMFQVYRLRVTHLKADEGSGAKDEKKQRRDCKAEFPALSVAATALPRLTKLHRKLVCFHSILSPSNSFSLSSLMSRGSTTSPRSPSSPTSSTSTSGTDSTSR